ncbi:tRNA methyltransferase 10 homolog A-like [Oppia nitens]|uniref:tRNA methyltransferase 10 homolog A-like n=1 Tax=Oppia nitens TaxID=1686743 RepID=UPI0023D9F0F7|nr:tRNA methyltransferase 10 homolog A-like [Oppia nitens]
MSTNFLHVDNESNQSDAQISDPPIGVQIDESTTPKLSKRKMKRLIKQQKWLESRPEMRKKEKEKKKMKIKKLREEGVEINRVVVKKQLIPMSSSNCKVCICIDCHFEQYMDERDMKKLVKQIGRCYAVNRHSSSPTQLYITSITSKIKEVFEKSQPGFTNWDAICLDKHWTQVFDDKQTKVIYMTSDSEHTIPDPKVICDANDFVFIIGGLVDHNRHKGLCHRLAVEKSCKTGRLPIDEYIEMSQRRVLAVNHVFEIMLLASNGSLLDWTQIFNKVIPLRKLK